MTREEIAWLAGLLEGEGSFLKGPPSKPNLPIIAVQMTDEDIIARVAALWSRGYYVGSEATDRHKKTFITRIRGQDAVGWMLALRPFMGVRRQAQIDEAVASFYVKKPCKLTKDDAERIRAELSAGRTAADLGREFNVSHTMIRKIRDGSSWI